MNRYSLWRYAVMALLIVLGAVYALPNLFGDDPAVQVSTRDGSAVSSRLVDSIKDQLSAQKLSYRSVSSVNRGVVIRLPSTETQLETQALLQTKLGSRYVVAMSLAPRTPKWLLGIGATPMKLGLDLRGGVHFLIEVDTGSMVVAREKADTRAIGLQLREKGIRYAGIVLIDKGGFLIGFRKNAAQLAGLTFLRKRYPDYSFVETTQGTQPAIKALFTPDALQKLENYAVEQNLSILSARVNELGIAEPVIQRQGKNQISVDLPGVQDMARAKNIIGKMATIRMQLVDTRNDSSTVASSGAVPFGSQLYTLENGQPILLKDDVLLTGSAIINASSSLDENGRPAVNIRIGGSAVSRFNQVTGDSIGKPMAVVYIENQDQKELVHGKVVTRNLTVAKVINVATINSALGNNFQITGLKSMQYANNLALLLRSGAYKAQMNFVQERNVGPSLGKKNIQMGLTSLEIGAAIVFLFMIFYYRFFGMVADLALVLNLVFIVAIQSVLGATMTLAGMAALVLTVGMAVDANVLINERIREELRNGVSPQTAINSGYDRAFATIVDANITTLIVAVILMTIGSSSVQGFAVTLIIGLLTSMVTAIFFTRAAVNLVYGGRSLKQLSIGIKV